MVATCQSSVGTHEPDFSLAQLQPHRSRFCLIFRKPKLRLGMTCARFCATVFVIPLLVSPALGSRCGPQKYAFSASKCCKKCSPGEEMIKRCTAQTETLCGPCEPGYYSQDFNEDSTCRACTVCHAENGLQEVKKCEKTSNTVCTCLPGYSPGHHEDKKNCEECPSGYFSKGGNNKCQPWTNCTAKGRKLLRAGRKDDDAVCDDQPSVPPKLVVTTTLHSTLAMGSTTTLGALTTSTKEEPSRVNHWGFSVILLICTTVILGMGGSVLCLLKSKQRKMKQRLLETTCQGDRKSSYRIPIQEEQVDYKSSLVRN